MAAAVNPLVSVYEYLHSVYETDMDYVDGVLEERNLGEHDHSDLQSELITLFRNHRKDWRVKTLVEQRVQVSPTRYRVPDLCVLGASWTRTPIIKVPPLLCIEVLSPEDRLPRVKVKCEDFFNLGVPEIWVFDPVKRDVLILRPGGFSSRLNEGTLALEGTPIQVPLADIFGVLDDDLIE